MSTLQAASKQFDRFFCPSDCGSN